MKNVEVSVKNLKEIDSLINRKEKAIYLKIKMRNY